MPASPGPSRETRVPMEVLYPPWAACKQQGSDCDCSMGQPWPGLAPAPVQTALTACRWKEHELSKEPPKRTQAPERGFIGHTEFCLTPRATAMSLLPMRLLLPSFASFSLLVPPKGWEHGEVLSFTLEFTRFSLYFPKGGAWSRFFLGAVCCPWFSGISQRWG